MDFTSHYANKKAVSLTAGQESLRFLRIPKVSYCNNKSSPLARILGQMNPALTLTPYLFLLFSHLELGLQICLFISMLQNKILYKFFFSLKRPACPVYLTLLDLITLIIFND
jgi:hypothetical protein